MDQFDLIFKALVATFQPSLLGMNFMGVFVGIIIGSIPGLTATMGVAVAVPLTFGMDSTAAIVFLIGIYTGGISGGLISAILLRMPGTPASIATTFDGYPMTKKGQPGRAIGIGVISSFIGGIFSAICLIFISPPLGELALKMGPFEYFSLVVMALVLVASLIKGSTVKGLIVAVIGILVSMVGMCSQSGTIRLTFGINALNGGFGITTALIGLFALPEIMRSVENLRIPQEKIPQKISNFFPKLKEIKEWSGNLLRSSAIGTWIGILPGIGNAAAAVLAYGQAKQFSKYPEKFSTGIPDGIVASEAANNAAVGGALIPLFAMGIPGSAADAVLLGGLMIHNLQPGPLLFQQHSLIVYTCFTSYLISNFFIPIIILGGLKLIIKAIDIPKYIILSSILIFCTVGAFAINNRMFDVWTLIIFGVLGYFFEKYDYNLQPFVLGIILGPLAEEQLRVGLMASAGSFAPLFTSPVSFCMLLIAFGSIAVPLLLERRKKRNIPLRK